MEGYTPHSDEERKVIMHDSEAYQDWLAEYSEMTLDDAISHAEETAKKLTDMTSVVDGEKYDECLKCAAQHEQLVKWLKELKEVKEVKGDAISRDLVRKDISNQINYFEELDKLGGHYEDFTDMKPILYGLQIALTIIDDATTLRPVKNVLYVCDQKRCEKCSSSENQCFMTTDVSHAVSFEEIYKGVFAERTHSDSYTAGYNEARAKFERKKAEWKHLGGDEWVCSECGHVITTEGSFENPLSIGAYHCENCGAEMVNDEGGEKNDSCDT